jgi:uncharacterized LabA/DUF88 family protein
MTDGNGHKSREDFMDAVIVGQTKPSPQLANALELNDLPTLAHKSRGRVAVFIDASNLFYAAQELNITVDYDKLLCQLVNGSKLLRAFFYTAVDSTNSKQQGFLLWLRRHGYRVIAKELISLPDGTKKANVEVEMAVDMLDLAPYYDTAILVSGNGALTYAVNAVSYLGVRVEIVSLRSMTSDSLLSMADVHIDLQQIKEQIQK